MNQSWTTCFICRERKRLANKQTTKRKAGVFNDVPEARRDSFQAVEKSPTTGPQVEACQDPFNSDLDTESSDAED